MASSIHPITPKFSTKNNTMQVDEKEAVKLLSNKLWRISNLYYIKDKSGNKVLFKPN
jgi:hypothetical protein